MVYGATGIYIVGFATELALIIGKSGKISEQFNLKFD
jgi:hypothetical protein